MGVLKREMLDYSNEIWVWDFNFGFYNIFFIYLDVFLYFFI